MVNILLIVLIVNSIMGIVFRRSPNILCCGIWGWVGKKKEDWTPLTKFKFEMLGVANDYRGGDSCGIAYDNTVKKSNSIKKFDDFWRNDNVPSSLSYPVIMGHDRKASIGIHSFENAQPICFVGSKLVHSILSHNGTLLNHIELYKKYAMHRFHDSDLKDMSDSQIFALLLDKVGWDILSEYNGAAAILYMNTAEPGVLYAYHGKSPSRKAFVATEERPLHYVTSDDGTWFSSTKAALEIITPLKKDVQELPFNVVMRFDENGVTEVTKVSRDKNFQMEDYVVAKGYPRGSIYYEEDYYDYPKHEHGCQSWNKPRKEETKKKDDKMSLSKYNGCQAFPGCTAWSKGRFWSGEELLHGKVIMARSGRVMNTESDSTLTLYFWNGNLMKGCQEYIDTLREYTNLPKENSGKEFFHAIRTRLVLPYIIPKEYGGDEDMLYNIPKFPSAPPFPFTGIIEPVFSSKSFSFKYGLLEEVSNTSKYNAINVIEQFADKKTPEMFKDEVDKILSKKNEEEEEDFDDLMECPECFGTGFNSMNGEACGLCQGTGFVDGELVQNELESIVSTGEMINAKVQEFKIESSILQLIESGSSKLSLTNSIHTYNKLRKIKNMLND